MKILLLGEYSNVHWTLANALRSMGHEVVVASDGDWFKGYKRDIDLKGKFRGHFILRYLSNIINGNFKGYDIVQIINYRFLESKHSHAFGRLIFKYLKRNNRKVVLGAFGDDYYYLDARKKGKLEYSILDCWHRNTVESLLRNHYTKAAHSLNKYIAERVDGIVSCMYEYFVGYKDLYGDKLVYIPLPVDLSEIKFQDNIVKSTPVIFLGVQKNRFVKGSELILKALQEIKKENEVEFNIVKAVSLPYHEYLQAFDSSNLFFDQTYSYSSGMNGLLGMASGKILFGGGEAKSYEIAGEYDNRPIVNLKPEVEEIKKTVSDFLKNKSAEDIRRLGEASRRYVEDHHDSHKVAAQYLNFYKSLDRYYD